MTEKEQKALEYIQRHREFDELEFDQLTDAYDELIAVMECEDSTN